MSQTTASDLATAIIENIKTYGGRTDRIRSVIEAFENSLKHLIARAEGDSKLIPLHRRTGKEPVEMLKDVCTKVVHATKFVDTLSETRDADLFSTTVSLIREVLEPVMRAFAAAKSSTAKSVARELQAFLNVPEVQGEAA